MIDMLIVVLNKLQYRIGLNYYGWWFYGIWVLHCTWRTGRGLFKAYMRVVFPKVSIKMNWSTWDYSLLYLYNEGWGHQEKWSVKSLLNHEVNTKVNVEYELCETYIYDKAKGLSFRSSDNCSSPGEIIFADVCGPFDKSFRKCQYFVVFKYQFSKFRYFIFPR